jgi:hypothetical protein
MTPLKETVKVIPQFLIFVLLGIPDKLHPLYNKISDQVFISLK